VSDPYDDPAALSTTCTLDGVAAPCASPFTASALADGPHTLTLQATDAAGNTSPVQSVTWSVDGSAPTASLRSLSPFTLASSIAPSWSGGDAGSGVLSYDLRYQYARDTTGFSSWRYPASLQRTAVRSTTISGIPAGYNYCVSVRSRDRAGNLSAWTPSACSARALDDRALSAGTGWTRLSSSSYYVSTFTSSSRIGATLTRSNTLIDRIGVVATTCPSCGKVGVYLNGSLYRTIDLYRSTLVRKVLFSLPRFSYRKATVTLKVLTTNKLVEIDGLALSRT